MKATVSVFWFRRDLRLEDNAGLYQALRSGNPVLPVFIFDRKILDKLEDRADRRVEFIHAALTKMQEELARAGSSLDVRYGYPVNVWRELLSQYSVARVFANEDYEPYATERDTAVKKLLAEHCADLHLFKDQVIFSKDEVLKPDGEPYTVFTPYSRKWLARFNEQPPSSWPVKKYAGNFYKDAAQSFPKHAAQTFPKEAMQTIPVLASMGFRSGGLPFPSVRLREGLIKEYEKCRNFPGIPGTSRMGVHLRFGTVSIRRLVQKASLLSSTFLNELLWREFYQMILWHFPNVGKGKAFKPAYDWIKWRNKEEEFEAWCKGMTGYPIVDAGMRELNTTGFMHNRVRMIVASFLAKHLLIDWRWGEAYFAAKLLDFELASNNGNWQWAAGSGCDAAPYFRVFNPERQTKKFDPDLVYIRRWVPELGSGDYPPPIVDHGLARKRALDVYGKALKRGSK